jgi:hypothetical protein
MKLLKTALIANDILKGFFGASGETHSLFFFEHSAQINGTGCKEIEWTVDPKGHKIFLSIKSMPDSDWVGLGVSDTGGMKGADIITVKNIKSGGGEEVSFGIEDSVANEDSVKLASKGTLQRSELIFAEFVDNGSIYAIFSRDLDPGEKGGLPPFSSHDPYLICASGKLDENDDLTYLLKI